MLLASKACLVRSICASEAKTADSLVSSMVVGIMMVYFKDFFIKHAAWLVSQAAV